VEEFTRPRAIDRGVRRNWLGDGTYTVSVEADAYAPERIPLDVPNPQPGVPIPVQLRPGHGYPFRNAAPLEPPSVPGSCFPALQTEGTGPSLLRGSLHAVDGTPIAGASIDAVDGSPIAGVSIVVAGPFVTGPTGDWLLVLPDRRNTGLTTVRITLPDGSQIDVPNVCVVRGREVALRETALRGWVLQGKHGVAGATVAVTGQPGVSTTGSDGGWFHYFSPDPNALPAAPVSVVATLPSGETQAQTETVRERATTLVPTFRFP
jgi:hypothetical protein